jgi:hypothetical protein
MVDDKVLDKIRKLLALAGENGFTNDNEHEAKVAFRKAAELMEEHGLGMADIGSKGEKSNILDFKIRAGIEKYKVWSTRLMSSLAMCFDSKCITLGGSNDMIVVGMKEDVEMIVWYFNYLKIRIARAASTKYSTIGDQKSYGLGCVTSLHKRLQEMFVKIREEVRTETTTALVVVKKKEIDNKFKELFPSARMVKSNPKVRNGSFNHGFEDGKTMGIGRPIGQDHRERMEA